METLIIICVVVGVAVTIGAVGTKRGRRVVDLVMGTNRPPNDNEHQR